MSEWRTRAEQPGDELAIGEIARAAFPGDAEAGLVEALRADPAAWIDGLSTVAVAADGSLVGHALLTRCHVGGSPALALAPCAVLPECQRRGAGSAAIRGALNAARGRGENLVVVLGHAEYYPRFGFTPAAEHGISAPVPVPEEAFMVLSLDPEREAPAGTVEYPGAFGI